MQTEYGWISERGRERPRGEKRKERNKERGKEREREMERWSGRKRLKEKKERRKQSSAPLSFAIMHGTSQRAVHLQRGCKTFRYRDIFFLPSLLYPSFMRSKYLHIVNWSNVSFHMDGATRSHNAIKPYIVTAYFT